MVSGENLSLAEQRK
jgi:chromosome segregation ATPase